MLQLVLNVARKYPANFSSLADLNQGVDPTTFEVDTVSDRLAKAALLVPVTEQLTTFLQQLSDSSLEMNQGGAQPAREAYVLAKALARTNPIVSSMIAPSSGTTPPSPRRRRRPARRTKRPRPRPRPLRRRPLRPQPRRRRADGPRWGRRVQGGVARRPPAVGGIDLREVVAVSGEVDSFPGRSTGSPARASGSPAAASATTKRPSGSTGKRTHLSGETEATSGETEEASRRPSRRPGDVSRMSRETEGASGETEEASGASQVRNPARAHARAAAVRSGRRDLRAEPVDALVGRIAAVGRGRALLLRGGAVARREACWCRRAPRPAPARSSRCSTDRRTGTGAVGLAGVEHPEAARVAGEDLLGREVERGVARVGAGRRVQVDRRDPELLDGRLRETGRVVVGRPALPAGRRELVAVEAAAGEDDPGVAARPRRGARWARS